MISTSKTEDSKEITSDEKEIMSYAKVAVDLPLPLNIDDCFYYSIPQEIKEDTKAGTVVHIPFGKNELIGYVLETYSEKALIPVKENQKNFQIKSIYEVIYKKSIWDGKFLEFANWISNYYLTNIGTVLGASISSEIMTHYTHEVELVDLDKNDQLTSDEHFIVDKLLKSKKKSLTYKFLIQKSKLTKQQFYQLINQLKKKNIVRAKIKTQKSEHKVQEVEFSAFRSLSSAHQHIDTSVQLILNKDQQNAFNIILQSIQSKKYSPFLLHGVTGSGKTEVYLKLIEKVLTMDKSVIYLVPEIYLVPQVYQRIIERFGKSQVLIWHSSLSKNERLNNWEKLQNNNEPKIILGARSAILAPLSNIGLIVVDEAHESSYKQGSKAPRYDAITLAKKRGKLENCPVILGSATPNITDYYNSLKNNFLLELPKRIENVPMPKVYLIDLKKEYPQSNKNIISNVLKSSIKEALEKKEQTILLLNRRGYSSHIFCRACGYIQYCKNCSVPLVFHKNHNLMICHHCGYRKSIAISLQCPECKSPHFKYFGLGTQQLEEEVKKIFKNAKTIRVDSDQLRKKDEYLNSWHEFSSGQADILIGTQLVAKGIDLPNVTVVGVILADSMLNFPDYVSHERAFQLLTQITGRAGRGQKPGRVFIQTYQIENKLFNFIQEHDFSGFYKSEIGEREQFQYPPYTKLVRLIFQSYSETECLDYANEVLEQLSAISLSSSVSFLGPAPCFFTKLHTKYRYHILCKIKNEETKNFIFDNLFQKLNKNAKVDLIIDVDSVNLL